MNGSYSIPRAIRRPEHPDFDKGIPRLFDGSNCFLAVDPGGVEPPSGIRFKIALQV